MKRLTLFLVLVISLSSCGAKRVKSSAESSGIVLGKTVVTNYHSLGNGVADINLAFYENNTFLLDIKSIAQPGSNDKPFKIHEKGTYKKEGNWNVLSFKDSKFSVPSVFDASLSNPGDFEIINEETVKINNSKDGIMIWGIFCELK